MKIFRRILLIILILIALFFAGGFLLPKHAQITRAIAITGDKSYLFELVNTVKNWETWSPWYRIDPLMKLQYTGEKRGNGASYSWQSKDKNVGNGTLTIIQSVPDDSIAMEMDFMNNGKTSGIFKFLPQNGKTLVSWRLESDMGNNPLARYAGLFMNKMVGPDLARGLANIDSLAKLNASETHFFIEEKDLPQRIVLSIRDTCTAATISSKLSTMYGKLAAFIKVRHLKILNPPFAIYYSFSEDKFDVEAGFQVNRNVNVPNNIKLSLYPIRHTVCAKYYGSYGSILKTYGAIRKYVEEKHLLVNGPPIEEYVSDSSTEKDPSKWLTNIYFVVSAPKAEN